MYNLVLSPDSPLELVNALISLLPALCSVLSVFWSEIYVRACLLYVWCSLLFPFSSLLSHVFNSMLSPISYIFRVHSFALVSLLLCSLTSCLLSIVFFSLLFFFLFSLLSTLFHLFYALSSFSSHLLGPFLPCKLYITFTLYDVLYFSNFWLFSSYIHTIIIL